MDAWRRRPMGWRGESYRHYLAAKGVKTKYRKQFPDLVKAFPGENPRLTAHYARFRQRAPSHFVPGTFRTKRVGKKKIVLGREKKTGKFVVQSVLIGRSGYWARKVLKKGRIEYTRSGEDVRKHATEMLQDIRPYVKEAEIVGSIRRRVPNPVDVDIVAVPKVQKKDDLQAFLRGRAVKVYAEGARKFSGRIHGIKTEVVFAQPEEYGAAKMTYTGPYGANIYKRGLAKRKGWLLNEKGLFDARGRRIASTEAQIYRRLGLTYRRPELRGLPR